MKRSRNDNDSVTTSTMLDGQNINAFEIVFDSIPSSSEINYIIYVPNGNNIFEEIQKYQSELNSSTQTYQIKSLRVVPACWGCRNDRCGQDDHMELPYGCLANN